MKLSTSKISVTSTAADTMHNAFDSLTEEYDNVKKSLQSHKVNENDDIYAKFEAKLNRLGQLIKQDSKGKLPNKVNVNKVNAYVKCTSDNNSNKDELCLSQILDNAMSIYD